MRPELTKIKLIEKYLNGTLNEIDRIEFEQELNVDPELASTVETQKLMVTAVERKAMLETVEAYAPSAPGMASPLKKFMWPIIFSVIIMGLFVVWQFVGGDTPTASGNNIISEVETVIETNDDHSLASENSVEEECEDVPVDVNRTSWTNTDQKEFAGLKTWVAPEVQKVHIDPNKTELIECKEGTVILFPKGVFQDSDGNTVAEDITVEIIEALTMDKFVAYNLATMSNGHALQSGGMLYMQAKRGDEVLSVKPGEAVHIEIPTDNYDPEMKIWDGVADGNGNLNWENPREMERYLIPVDMASLDFLPNGFREEVQSSLPYKNHRKSSIALEDSLYYAISGFCNTEDDENIVGENVVEFPIIVNDKSDKSKGWSFHRKRRNNSIERESSTDFVGGSVKFDNLPEGIEFGANIQAGKLNYNVDVEKGEIVDVMYSGEVRIALTSGTCDEYVFERIQLIGGDKITILDCSEINCNVELGFLSSEEVNTCYIDPSSIYSIHQKKFEHTFIATREFEERLQALHKVPNAQKLLELYVNQLDKDLCAIDQQVADKVSEPYKSVFKTFAKEKLTNVRPNGQDFEKLSQYYSAQLKAKRMEEKRKNAAYERKTTEQLKSLQKEMVKLTEDYNNKREETLKKFYEKERNNRDISSNKDLSSTIANALNRRPIVGQQASYKIPWYGASWTNCDKYFQELSSGEQIVAVNAEAQKGSKIYQSVPTLNTMLTLNARDNKYEAHFPKKASSIYRNSVCVGVTEKLDGNLDLCSVKFDPYQTSSVVLSKWKTYSESEFKNRLREIYPIAVGITKAMEDEKKRIQEAILFNQRAAERARKKDQALVKLESEFKDIKAKISRARMEILKKQREEERYMQNLIDFINPCSKDDNLTSTYPISETRAVLQFEELPDAEPQFPGGYGAMRQFVSDNTQYPADAIEKGLSGRIMVKAIINSDGSIGTTIIENPDPKMGLLETEALRIVRSMPNWIPAQVDDQDIATTIRIPINFTLD